MDSFFRVQLPSLVNWIPSKIGDYSAWKPAIRSAVAGWLCLVLFLIVPIARSLGQAAFFVVLVSYLYPPTAPLEIAFEQLFTMLAMVGLAWLWAVIASAIAETVRIAPAAETLARYTSRYPGMPMATVSSLIIFDGAYLSAPSSVVYACFLGFGSAFFLYIKARDVKLALPAVLACILLDVACSYGALIPGFHNTALLGQVFYKPMCLFVAVALVASCLVFPQSVQDKYIQMLVASLNSVKGITALQNPLLATNPLSPEWNKFQKMGGLRAGASMAYQGMMSGKPSLTREFCFGRLQGRDLASAEEKIRRLIARAGGLHSYYELMCTWTKRYRAVQTDGDGDKDPKSSTPTNTQSSGDPHSTTTSRQSPHTTGDMRPRIRHKNSHQHSRHIHLHTNVVKGHRSKPVGVFESVRFMHVESRFIQPGDDKNVIEMTEKLGLVCQNLIDACFTGVQCSSDWFIAINEERLLRRMGLDHLTFTSLYRRYKKGPKKSANEDKLSLHEARDRLHLELDSFVTQNRMDVFEPYHKYFDKAEVDGESQDSDMLDFDHQAHRGLFYSMFYQFELIQFAKAVEDVLAFVIQMDGDAGEIRLQRPRFKGFLDFFKFASLQDPGHHDADQPDEDPEEISGVRVFNDKIEARDPDAGYPNTLFQWLVRMGSRLLKTATRGNLWFAMKAGIITVLITLPQYFPASARFYYYNRGLWAIIMAQLTFQRFTGDTIMQYGFRVVVTFAGAIVGMLFWYIGSGSGKGNPYGLAAVAVVVYPFLFFIRANTPPLNIVPTIVFGVTVALVVSYSRQDGLGGFSLIDTGIGYQVAWKRFVVVMIGITAAFIAAFLPPESSRHQVRKTLAKTLEKLGEVHMDLLSFAQRKHSKPDLMIIGNLISINSKLRIFLPQRLMTGPYEIKAGPWPKAKYEEIQRLQLEISDLLAQLMVVFLFIDDKWRQLLLLRTRFLDPKFIGEITAVLWMMSTALATGRPLPAVTPCPLTDRSFMLPWWAHAMKSAANSRANSRTASRTTSQVDLSEALLDEKALPNESPGQKHGVDHVHFPTPRVGHNDGDIDGFQDEASHEKGDMPLASIRSDGASDEILSLEILQDPGYMAFSAGTTLSFALLYRIDHLMRVVKELVGEAYLVRDLNVDAIEGRYASGV